MFSALASFLVPLLALSGAHLHYEAEGVVLEATPSCPVQIAEPLVLEFNGAGDCDGIVSDVDLPPGTTRVTWRFLHERTSANDTLVVESLSMGGQETNFAPARGDLRLQEREIAFEASEGHAQAQWAWLAVSPGNVSAQVRMQAMHVEAVADGVATLERGARQWTDGNLVDRGRLAVEVPPTPGWRPSLRFQLGQDMVPVSLLGPNGENLVDEAQWHDGILELPAYAMNGPGVYQLNVRMPGTFAAEAGMTATFLILVVGMVGGAALAGTVLLRYAEGPGRGHTRRVRLLAIGYGLLVTTSVVTMWQILVTQDTRIMLQAPLHPVAAAQYLAMLAQSLFFLLVVLVGGAVLLRHLRRRIRQGQDANEGLVHAQEEMTVLTAAAAHDLKSPLRAIHAYADLLQKQDPAHADVLENIKRSARRMTYGVESLMQFTRVANTRPNPRNVDLTSLMEAVYLEVQDLLVVRGIQLVQEGDAVVRADRALLHRAVVNLVENALKHGPPGGRVVVRAEDDGDQVRVEVVDEGEPISESERQLLFDAFHRGSTDVEGTGLGLATVAKVADLHGGVAGVECHGGNRFWIRLPGAGIETPREYHGLHPIVQPRAWRPEASPPPAQG